MALRIREKVSSFAEDPTSQASNVKALRGLDGVVRLRVGDWRLSIRDGVIIDILEVKPGGSAYKE